MPIKIKIANSGRPVRIEIDGEACTIRMETNEKPARTNMALSSSARALDDVTDAMRDAGLRVFLASDRVDTLKRSLENVYRAMDAARVARDRSGSPDAAS